MLSGIIDISSLKDNTISNLDILELRKKTDARFAIRSQQLLVLVVA